MSVREYIGARYLPLFPDDPQWSSTNTYEPLTVVQNLGSSYISRQYVPAGIQLSNTDYWVLWADFNSQIEQYRSEVQTFDGRITANADAIADETEERTTADTTLAGDIAAEKLARETADTALGDDIASETSARAAADSELEEAIAAKTAKIKNIHEINNSYVLFNREFESANSLQGVTPFSASNDYAPESASLYVAMMCGTDAARRLEIRSRNGELLSTVQMPAGHYGCVTYDVERNSLFSANYTQGAATQNILFEIDVTNPASAFIKNQFALKPAYFEAYNFVAGNGKIGVGKRLASGDIELYKFNIANSTYEYWTTLDISPYPFRGTNFAHVTYDPTNDIFIYAGYGSNGFTVYDANGKQVNTVVVAEMQNYVQVGELEELNIFNARYIWYGSRRNDGDFGEHNNRTAIFCYDLEKGAIDPYNQLLSAPNPVCVVDYTADVSGKMIIASNGVPTFHFFEDACNFVRRMNSLGKMPRLGVNGEYPYICHAWDTEFIYDNPGTNVSGTIPALSIRNGSNNILLTSNQFRDSEEVITASGSSFLIWIYGGTHQLTTTPAIAPTYAGRLGYSNNAVLQSRAINNWRLRNTIFTAQTLSNSSVEDYSYGICKTNTGNTVSANSGVVQA